MARSLNQAFIKAYSKDRAAKAVRLQAQDGEEDYVLRIDTATMKMPEPHFLGQRDAARPSEHASSTVSLEVFGTTPLPASKAQSLPSGELAECSEEELRASIASEMIKAGSWQEPPIDTFFGSLNMFSATRALSDDDTSEITPLRESKTPMSAVRQAPAPATVHASEKVRTEPSPNNSTPELSPLEAPALSFSQVEKAVEQLAHEHQSEGAIFRLDRPSYSQQRAAELAKQNEVTAARALATADDEELQFADSVEDLSEDNLDSVEDSSMIGELSGTQAFPDMELPTSSVGKAAAKAAEKSLRQAKRKIFNPLWEVDQLQWPEVCVQLMDQTASSLNRVSENLIAACQEGLQVLAVTSPQSGEGRTTVACCLAMLAGRNGLNVAIVDGDIENPTLCLQTNLDVVHDWKTAIFNQSSLEEVAVHAIDDQVTLLPLVEPIEHHEMASDDNRIAFMLHELSESFDLVIVDMGHMDSTRSLVTSMGEQGILSAVVTVIDHRNSSPQRVEACIRRLRRTGVSSIGVVENFAA